MCLVRRGLRKIGIQSQTLCGSSKHFQDEAPFRIHAIPAKGAEATLMSKPPSALHLAPLSQFTGYNKGMQLYL